MEYLKGVCKFDNSIGCSCGFLMRHNSGQLEGSWDMTQRWKLIILRRDR